MSQALETPGSGVPGTWRRGPAVLPAEVPKYPIPPPLSYPKHPVSFLTHQRTLSPIDFWCTLGINLSLSMPRTGFGGPNSITGGYSLSVYHPSHSLLPLPRSSLGLEPEVGTGRRGNQQTTVALSDRQAPGRVIAGWLLGNEPVAKTTRGTDAQKGSPGGAGAWDPGPGSRGPGRAACDLCITAVPPSSWDPFHHHSCW